MPRKILSWKYAIAVVVVLGFSVFVSHQDQKTREQYEQKCTQLNASTISPAFLYDDCDKGAENAARHLPRWYRLFGWPEGITTWAILLTLMVIAEQTEQAKRAAIATEDAARATQATVEAMKEQARDSHQKERARIVVKIVPDELTITQVLWQVKFQARNIGPTRAFDVWLDAEFEFTSSPVPPRIPQTKMLGYAPRIRPEKWRHFYSGLFFWGDDERGSNQARMQEVADGKLFLHLRGSASYQDIFGDPHVTPFRYLWNAEASPPRWFEAVHSGDPPKT